MATLPDTFCAFILTHGRPDNVITLKTLEKCGYTGRLYLVVDDEDKTIDRYRRNFGADRVIVFDKQAEADACDEGNNFDEHRTILMARNACFKIAEQLGVTHFIELDDDYTAFDYRVIVDEIGLVKPIKSIDSIFSMLLDFYKLSEAHSIAFAQGGDFIGSIDNGKAAYRFSRRKCMNSFLCSTLRPFKFIGAMNEDVNTYTTLGNRGALFLTVPVISLTQKTTQSQTGGITGMYQRFGTYCKAFTTVMMLPSAVKVSMMQSNNPRIHHAISWKQAVPCIISEKYRKEKAIQNRREEIQPEKNQSIIDRATLAYDAIKEYNQALLQNPLSDPAAAMREAIRPTLVNPPQQRETILLTWTRSTERTVSDDEIAAWYAVAKAINSATQLRDVLATMQAATAPDKAGCATAEGTMER